MSARSKSRSRAGPAPTRFDAHVHLSRYWPDLPKNSYGPDVRFTVAGLLAEFDAAGIGAGLLLQLNDAPGVDATLEEGAALAKSSHGRLLRTSTVDPTQGPTIVADAVTKWERTRDLAAIKLYPGYQRFFPHDGVLDPLYEFAARRHLPVLFHQGDTLDPAGLVKFARPIEVDEVAVRYRELPIVLCHMGNPWFEEAAELVYKNPNVYADTSGLLWDPRLPRFDALVQRAQVRLANAIAEIGDVSKILYGSDWPLESIDLATRFIEGLPISTADRAQILGENAVRLFGRAARGPPG